MAAGFHVYTKFQHSIAHKLCDLSADTLKVALLASYTGAAANLQSAQFYADVVTAGVGVEITSSGYSAGGVALTGITLTDSGAVTTLGVSGTPSWTGLTASPAFALFYDSTPGTGATNPVICYWDFGGAQSLTGANFQLNVSGSGLVTFTAS
jgi:hypothetical protein